MQVPGNYVDALKCTHAVVIRQLTCEDCQVAESRANADDGSRVIVWIGAVGPIEGTAASSGPDGFRIRFLHPLDQLVVEHFAAC